MVSIRPYLARAIEMFRGEPALTGVLFLGLWVPQALAWLVARGIARAGFQATQAAGAAVLVSIPLVLAAPAFAGGVMAMFGEAVRGREAGWDAFRDGLGRYYWRVVGGSLLLMVVAILVTVPLAAAAARGAAGELASQFGALTAAPSLLLLGAMARHPAFAVPFLVGLAIDFLFVYWAPALVLGQRTTLDAAASSLRFAVRTWLPTILAVLANVLVTSIVYGAVRALASGAVAPLEAAPPALALAAKTATAAGLAVTTFAVLIQALWDALYRSYLWTLNHGAGGNAG